MPATPPAKVYLFGTCLVDVFFPQAGIDAISLLEHAGVEAVFPQAQSCCGQPAYSSGYMDEARRVALAQLDCFPEDWPIVVLSGSCGGMMAHHYPKLFAGDAANEARVRRFSERVIEFTDFVVNRLGIALADLGPPEKVVLHTSCAARREMGTLTTGRALLARLAGVELVEQDHESECCGFGGTFAVRHPTISAAMVADKTRAIKACGAPNLVSADCGCLMNINGALQKQGERLQGEHIASFVWRRIGGEA